MEEYYVDLHLHTKCSDGEQTPEQVIAEAEKTGMSCIALTDHNFFAIHEPLQFGGLDVIPGAEFSTSYLYGDGEKKEIHVIGLFFDSVDPAIEKVWACIDKEAWMEAILALLNRLGYEISMEELKADNPESKRTSRTQVANLLVKKGYATDRDDAMDRLIGNRSPYYINPLDYVDYIPLKECVQVIHEYGGIPILAHPFHYGFTGEQVEELVARFSAIGGGPLGMEVYYSKYNDKEVQQLEKLADRFGLLPSVGSDRHKKVQKFARGGKALLDQMKDAVKAEKTCK